jgi:DNA-binding phage protein
MATRRKTEFLTPWDAAKYLRSEQDIAAYLAAALEAAPEDADFLTIVRDDIAQARAALERSHLAPHK